MFDYWGLRLACGKFLYGLGGRNQRKAIVALRRRSWGWSFFCVGIWRQFDLPASRYTSFSSSCGRSRLAKRPPPHCSLQKGASTRTYVHIPYHGTSKSFFCSSIISWCCYILKRAHALSSSFCSNRVVYEFAT